MEIVSCVTRSDRLQGLLACVRESESLIGLLVVALVMVGWLVMQYLAESRHSRRTWEVRSGTLATPAQFGSVRHAAAVYAFANQEYFQVILAEMKKALFAAGYELTRDKSLRMQLSSVDMRDISREITRARQHYMAPLLSEKALNDGIDDAVNNGSAAEWLSLLIRGNAREGWYITYSKQKEDAMLTDRQKGMWPVRQVIIVVTSDALAITRDLVRGLTEAAEMVSNKAFPENDNQLSLCVVPVTCTGIQVTLQRQLCSTPPGFFPGCTGQHVPAVLLEKTIDLPQDRDRRIIAVFAQITSSQPTNQLSRYLSVAAERIAAGEEHGAEYDDDNGYAFIVTRSIKIK